MRNLYLVLLGVACLFLASCGSSSNAKNQLIGKWKGTSKGATVENIMEFTKDGKVTKEAIGVKSVSTGTYQWIDSENIEIELTMPAGTSIKEKCKVTIDKDTLTLRNPQARVDTFTREP